MKLTNYIELFTDHYKKYPNGRKSGPRGKNVNISNSKRGKIWITSPDQMTAKLINKLDIIPPGWLLGLKTLSKIEKNRKASTGKQHTEETKINISNTAKTRKYYTSPDYTQLTSILPGEVPPIGWVLGNKLKTRNDKISSYLTEIRHANSKNKIN